MAARRNHRLISPQFCHNPIVFLFDTFRGLASRPITSNSRYIFAGPPHLPYPKQNNTIFKLTQFRALFFGTPLVSLSRHSCCLYQLLSISSLDKRLNISTLSLSSCYRKTLFQTLFKGTRGFATVILSCRTRPMDTFFSFNCVVYSLDLLSAVLTFLIEKRIR